MKVIRQVRREWRQGRGRYWCPDGAGYTDDIARAGLYDERGQFREDNFEELSPELVLEKAHAQALQRVETLMEMIEESRG